jgi:hypothetical protein
MLLELDSRFPLAGQVLSADALHTQDDFTKLAREKLGGHFALTAKKSRKNFFAALDALCRSGAVRHVTKDKGHGRDETRSHLVMDASEEIKALLPQVKQITRIHRVRTVRYSKGHGSTWRLVTKTARETVYLVTSPRRQLRRRGAHLARSPLSAGAGAAARRISSAERATAMPPARGQSTGRHRVPDAK